ncbi:type VII secretion EssA family protein [Sporosarcina sp.]|uniref:type VII secretion EssA family protein n=1 Tax=Sporosarcina sp. TaxID=49982 RepID=UPI002617C694|nr:type VII secretion EssA family protein [Sporosarcina sp.]
MKVKTMIVVIVMSMLMWQAAPLVGLVDSNDTINDLEPVIYEKLKFKKNTDYLHDDGKIEMKNTITNRQFEIQFDGSRKLPEKGDTSYLFQEVVRGGKSTVAAKSLEIGLFTKGKSGLQEKPITQIPDSSPNRNNLRTLIFLGLITLSLVIMFIFFVPKLVQVSSNDERKWGKR